ncbi:MAG: carbohydrate kinase family protein, partial [Butyricicoccaceae bacterium]
PSDFTDEAMQGSGIFCFASIFVFPLLGVPEMAEIFRRAKENGMIVCADTTMPKRGETLRDLAPALQYVDYLLPNLAEARAITGLSDPHEIVHAFRDAGVSSVVLKCGAKGCLLCNANEEVEVAGYPAQCIDTTGAGDNFAAGFLCAMLDGKNDLECARYANAVASISVEHVGANAGVTDRILADERYRQLLEQQL